MEINLSDYIIKEYINLYYKDTASLSDINVEFNVYKGIDEFKKPKAIFNARMNWIDRYDNLELRREKELSVEDVLTCCEYGFSKQSSAKDLEVESLEINYGLDDDEKPYFGGVIMDVREKRLNKIVK